MLCNCMCSGKIEVINSLLWYIYAGTIIVLNKDGYKELPEVFTALDTIEFQTSIQDVSLKMSTVKRKENEDTNGLTDEKV